MTGKRKNEKVSLNSESNIAALENKTHINKSKIKNENIYIIPFKLN